MLIQSLKAYQLQQQLVNPYVNKPTFTSDYSLDQRLYSLSPQYGHLGSQHGCLSELEEELVDQLPVALILLLLDSHALLLHAADVEFLARSAVTLEG